MTPKENTMTDTGTNEPEVPGTEPDNDDDVAPEVETPEQTGNE